VTDGWTGDTAVVSRYHDVLRDAAREVGCEHIEVVVVVEAAQGDQRFGSSPSGYLTPTS